MRRMWLRREIVMDGLPHLQTIQTIPVKHLRATSAHKPDLLDPQYFGFLDTDGSDAKNKFQWKTVLKIGKFYRLDPDPFFHMMFLIEMDPNH